MPAKAAGTAKRKKAAARKPQAKARSRKPETDPVQVPQQIMLASGKPRTRGQFKVGGKVGDLFLFEDGSITFVEAKGK